MRVLILNQVFYPDVAASAQHAHDLAAHLAARGHLVTVIASRSLHGQTGASLPSHEVVDGLEVHRVGANLFGRRSLLLRAVDSLLFYVLALARAMMMRRPDVVIACTSPPLIAFAGYLMKLVRGCRFVYWVMDLYPDIGVATGMINRRNPLVKGWAWLNRFCLRRADKAVVLGRCMRKQVMDKGADASRVQVIGVWADGQEITPVQPCDSPFRDQWSLGKAFVVMYSGNFGMGHDVETMCQAARRLAGRDDIRFVFAGGGHRKRQVESFMAEHRLDHAQSRPYQPREHLSALLGTADLHLLSQTANQTGLMVPSKLFGIMASGRPAVFIGDKEAEAARLLTEHGCGMVVPCGQVDRLTRIITDLADNRQKAHRLGERARAALLTHFDRRIQCDRWATLLENVLAMDP